MKSDRPLWTIGKVIWEKINSKLTLTKFFELNFSESLYSVGSVNRYIDFDTNLKYIKIANGTVVVENVNYEWIQLLIDPTCDRGQLIYLLNHFKIS